MWSARCKTGAFLKLNVNAMCIDGCALQVDNASISAAIKDVFNETRTILEPAGAVAVAGVKAYLKARPGIKVRTPHIHHWQMCT